MTIDGVEACLKTYPQIVVVVVALIGAGVLKIFKSPLLKLLSFINEQLKVMARPSPTVHCEQDVTYIQQIFWFYLFAGEIGKRVFVQIRGRFHITISGWWENQPRFIKVIFKPTQNIGTGYYENYGEFRENDDIPMDRMTLSEGRTYNLHIDVDIKMGHEIERKPLKGEIILVDQFGGEFSLGIRTFRAQ